MELNRKPTLQEERLLEILIENSSVLISKDWREGLLVRPMRDDGMGGLFLFPYGKIVKDRIFGKQVSEFQFIDSDGIAVITSLNLDSEGDLFELDIWKIDFGKLIKLPYIKT